MNKNVFADFESISLSRCREARTEEENEIRSCRIENDLSKTPSAVSGNICLEQPRYCGHVDVTKENDCKTVSITDTSIVSQADNLIEEMYTKNVRQNHGNRGNDSN